MTLAQQGAAATLVLAFRLRDYGCARHGWDGLRGWMLTYGTVRTDDTGRTNESILATYREATLGDDAAMWKVVEERDDTLLGWIIAARDAGVAPVNTVDELIALVDASDAQARKEIAAREEAARSAARDRVVGWCVFGILAVVGITIFEAWTIVLGVIACAVFAVALVGFLLDGFEWKGLGK